MRITKVKFGKKKIFVLYEEQSTDKKGWDDMHVNSADAPRVELLDAMAALGTHVIDLCEFPDKDDHNIVVTGVSISFGKNDVPGAVITARKRLTDSPAGLLINTPFKPFEPYKEGGSRKFLMPEECVEAIKTLIDEAKKYVQGKRAQGVFEFDNGVEEKKEEKAQKAA
jgi:hypothetical protein